MQAPAFRHSFGLGENDLQKLQLWINGAGIRWGLHSEHRTGFGLSESIDENTWQFGFHRMFLGYAVGAGEPWQGIEPYDEIGGLDAELMGPLHLIMDRMEKHWHQLKEPGTPQGLVRPNSDAVK